MEINSIKQNNVNFEKIYYTSYPISKKNMKYVSLMPERYVIEKNPPKIAKDIMETSRIFRDLKNSGSDIFVHMDAYDYNDPNKVNKIRGTLTTVFVNPYTKKDDGIEIHALGLCKETVFEKIKEVADSLPYINEIRQGIGGFPSIIRGFKEWIIMYNR